jgi:hypothetical protein
MKTLTFLLAAATVLIAGAGCASVKPWQRGNLADYTMRSDRDPVGTEQSEHIWFSREEANGGAGVGGGGCGCN